MYNKITQNIVDKLIAISGAANVITDRARMEDYSHDEYSLPAIKFYPEVIVKPRSTEEISEIMKLASAERIPVTPRGGGTGLCGACVPVHGGILMMFENMNKVLEVDTDNLMVTVESGVMLRDMYKEINKAGLFFPPHPGDDTATIGGVISTNAGGTRAVKHGVTRNFVRGMEIVLPDGSICTLGGKLMKNSTGYSLLNLIIGSEGTLAIVTKAVINLIPVPKHMVTLVAPFENLNDAIHTVPRIIQNKIIPLAIEFIEKDVIPITEKYLDKKWPVHQGKSDLMIMIDGSSEEELFGIAEQVGELCTANKAIDVFIADTHEKQETILTMRSNFYEAIKPHLVELLDICVPISKIAEFVSDVHAIADKYGLWLPVYGHAGDGNVHVHIMDAKLDKDDKWIIMDKPEFEKKYVPLRNELHMQGGKYNGIISGEHGIGYVKKDYLAETLGPVQVGLMKRIKSVFDPQNILNPDKIF
jgi:glycolate oxidase